MTAKEYLQQIGKIRRKIRQLEDEYEHILMLAGGLKGIDYSADKGAGHVDEDRMSKFIAKCIEIDAEIIVEKERYVSSYHKILGEISSLDDQRYVELLRLRYVEDKRLEDIACIMRKANGEYYSYKHIQKLHGWALLEFSKKILKCGSNAVLKSDTV